MIAGLEELVAGHHGDPFAVLGRQGGEVRTFQPGARGVTLLAREGGQEMGRLEPVHPGGLFAGPARDGAYRLRIEWPGSVQETEDPYDFGLLLGPLDLHLLAEGRHFEMGRVFGAQPMEIEGVPGVRFAVWAPNARRVSVVGDFNGWDGRRHPMRLRREAGVWELFIPRLAPGAAYSYEMLAADGSVLPLKADPVALSTEAPPATASRVPDAAPFHWTDEAWMAGREARQALDAPISIYEVHPGSWWRDAEGEAPDWDRLADRLIPYAQGLGFTHLEFLPITEHPFGGSWGYQPLSLFAPSARFGDAAGFARFVDRAHAAGLGVLLDWVPAHFPTDPHGLYRFDGSPLYEHADAREGFHRDWNTAIYNFGRNEVRSFLISSALHWLERFHVDGLRVDAVASMLYRDYSRPQGEWIPNRHGGRENLEAVAFLRELNTIVRERCPGAVMIAEESTAWPGVTKAVEEGGLGFHYKWNMGWMNDTLGYMHQEPIHRRHHHGAMTFGLVYAWSEHFILPISHDEVVHGKGSLLGKMPGDTWQKLANLRAYLAFMWAHPGRKLLFMGNELAQPAEWNHDAALAWHLLDQPAHRGVQHLLRDLNALYRAQPALHRADARPEGFRWIIADDADHSVLAWLRLGAEGDEPVLVACNMTPVPRHGYRLGVPATGEWAELLNTDAGLYGGGNMGNGGAVRAEPIGAHGFAQSVALTLPPLATLVLGRRA
ncbi:1,4-alpha-glucan branching protein GlgB [Roseococcus thiosulfatophilus]|uniref:1,4-alpha-glucan branching protein GlgB n=1 Tax=Roseococcus thiosulfatophilus TaxID=35813 RepID=UPI001A8E6F5B|nr:1,4-alpha-glucan branching protein GlgB [Roseococcus thiosulfatophilus]